MAGSGEFASSLGRTFTARAAAERLVFAYPDEFLDAWQTHREPQKPVLVSVELPMRPDAPVNDTHQLPAFVAAEFERLLPLYRFCSWDPEKNSFLQHL